MEIGIDCGGSKCEGIVVDKGRIIDHVILAKPSTKKVLFSVIDVLLKNNPEVTFIGIGFPAPIMHGKAQKVNNIKAWDNVNIEQLVIKRYSISCRVENDASCFALAEAVQNSQINIVIGITLGTGIGCGIIIDKKIFKGSTGSAGEINKWQFQKTDIEDYTSKQFFLKKYKKDSIEIFKKAELGSKNAQKAINEFASNLGNMLAMVISAFDPGCIIFGGNISNSFEMFEKQMRAELKKHIYKHQYEKLIIKKSDLAHSSSIGAAMLHNM